MLRSLFAALALALALLCSAGTATADIPFGCDPIDAPEYCHTETVADEDTDDVCDFSSAPRLWGTGDLLEDEAPYFGACGGDLLDYDGAGVATYTDGTATDGRVWFWTDEDLTVCRYEADAMAWISAATPTYGEPCAYR